MDYNMQLLEAINNYDEKDSESKLLLRDLVCMISDNENYKEDPLTKELLFAASQKMRVFGYNIQNKFLQENSEFKSVASNITNFKNQSILQKYRSKVHPNNILDKTQKEVIDFYQSINPKRMLVSAPTSYGKTFIMREILYLNKDRYNNVLLVFPTVALLRENAQTMESLNREKELNYNVIKSVDSEVDILGRNIFVFTPERALQLLSTYPNIKIDFFFYDEMYKIDEGFCNDELDEKIEDKSDNLKINQYFKSDFLNEGRAKTFRICLYLLAKTVNEYYLAGPNLKEDKFGLGMKEFLDRNSVKVKEIQFEPTKRILVKAYNTYIEEVYNDLLSSNTNVKTKLSSNMNDRICDIVQYISDSDYGSTLLYCTTPTKANEYATILSNKLDNSPAESIKEVDIFIDHLRRAYNIDDSINNWSFLNVLEKGFGIHHGKMPKYIQKEILELFNAGIFTSMFCTSTIVEGVNTNAKNMVLLNSSKGREKLTYFDFKNIIGRAGRYYHNFLGRYFLVNSELRKFENATDLSLDFITYSTKKISEIDLDNSLIEDLQLPNKSLKEKRIELHKNYKLPEEVFLKNRLIRKEYQEQILNYLILNNYKFNELNKIFKSPNLLESFIKYASLNRLIDILIELELLGEKQGKAYKAINNSYRGLGFKGLLKYELKIANNGEQTIDKAYMNAFKTQKDLIEHKFPKILLLFEALFVCAANIKGIDMSEFSLSKVARFYETGVKSYLGEQLIEFGFPVDAIRSIEGHHPNLIKYNLKDTIEYINKEKSDIVSLLDEYEQNLFERALYSLNEK